MSKIGQDARLKLKDLGKYKTLGIAKTDEGYELRRVTMDGAEATNVEVLAKTEQRAEIMEEMMMALGKYVMNFNEQNSK
jgi:hypothetical protein